VENIHTMVSERLKNHIVLFLYRVEDQDLIEYRKNLCDAVMKEMKCDIETAIDTILAADRNGLPPHNEWNGNGAISSEWDGKQPIVEWLGLGPSILEPQDPYGVDINSSALTTMRK
jgi:hypothetical protein